GEPGIHSKTFERYLELIIRSAIQVRTGHEILAGLQNIVKGQQLGRLSGSRPQRGDTTFKRRNAFLENIGRGVHEPRIDVPELLQFEKIGAKLRAVDDIRSRLVNRDRTRICHQIMYQTSM